jgi:glycosyltransferase involved in cell wall biosynthesis
MSVPQRVGEMRIAYVLTSLGMGGAERQVVALAERMAARGHAVSLLVLRPRQPEEWHTAVDCVYLDARKTPFSLLAALARGRSLLRVFKPDLVHSHVFPANMAARLLRLFASAPVLSTVHNVYEGSWPRMLAYRLTDPLSCWTTAVSQAAADRYVRLKAVPARKCSVVTNGIDTAEFAPDLERRVRMRQEMGTGDEFIWLTAGRIAQAKDYPNLLRAFARVTESQAPTRLWVAGDGDVDDLSDLIVLADELGLRGRVRWLGLRRDLPALLDAADGFVLGSAWEGMPLVVGEAMAMEKPVVATDVGGVRELVGDTGVLVPAKDPERLAKAMLGLMRSMPEARCSLGHKARERIQTQFSMDAKANKWEALYSVLLEKRR